MRAILLAVVPLLAAGCSKGAGDAAKPVAEASASAAPSSAPSVSAGAQAMAGEARKVEVSNDLYEFEYAYPAAAGAIPALKSWFDSDIEKQRGDLAKDAREQQAESRKGDFPYRALGRWIDWQVVTDLPGWLSLSAGVSTYEGGAHPNHVSDALVWDRQANVRRDPIDFFTSKAALSAAIRKDFCAALDRQRAKKRGEPVKPDSDDPFTECIDPVDSTIILGSSNRKAFDRVGVLVAPYEAGPYAEGGYEVTLPVTPAVLATVKPEFRPTFVAAR